MYWKPYRDEIATSVELAASTSRLVTITHNPYPPLWISSPAHKLTAQPTPHHPHAPSPHPRSQTYKHWISPGQPKRSKAPAIQTSATPLSLPPKSNSTQPCISLSCPDHTKSLYRAIIRKNSEMFKDLLASHSPPSQKSNAVPVGSSP